MALDFPSNPTDGQTYNGYVYSVSVGAWQVKPSSQSPFYTRDTPPVNPVPGDSWFNTNDGTMYVYVNDGTSSQWVEHRSQIAKSQVGLVPITPTSVSATSGTISISSTGEITVSSASDIKLNGIFSSSFRNYEIRYARPDASSTTANVYARFTTAGIDNPNSNYIYAGFYVQTNGTGTWPYSGAFNWMQIGYWENAVLRIFNPFNTQATSGTWDVAYGQTRGMGQLGFTGNASFDGMQFSNNYYSGTFKVYGYN